MATAAGSPPAAAPLRPFRVLQFCVVALVAGWALGRSGVFTKVEQHVLDFWATVAPADDSLRKIAVVRITEHDYATTFGSRRPLAAPALRRLIDAIAVHRPLAIGVDVDTSSSEWADVRPAVAVPVAWARDTRLIDGRIESRPVLGVTPPDAEPRDVPAGLGLILADGQGVTRRYQRAFITSRGVEPSFTCAILRQCGASPGCAPIVPAAVLQACAGPDLDTDTRVIGYRRAFSMQTPSPFYSAAEVLASVTQSPADRELWRQAFADRIVLVGGTFAASGDAAHATPLGTMPGVEVIAQILATELRGGGAAPTRAIATATVLVFETYLILLITRLPRRRSVVAGAGLVLLLAAVLSLVHEGTFRRTPYFGVILTGILLLQVSLQIVSRSQKMFVEAVVAWRRRR